MSAYRCSSCATQYSQEYVQKWGKTALSDGHGPRPVCTALVPAPDAPKAPKKRPDGSLEFEEPQQQCRGELVFIPTGKADLDDDAAPIDPFKKRN